MNVLGLILFIIFMLVAVIGFVKVVLDTRQLLTRPAKFIDWKKTLKTYLFFVLGISISFTISINMIYVWNKITPKIYELLASIFFVFLFISSITLFYISFRLHYYLTDNDKKVDKLLYRIMIISIPVMIITLWYSFNGFANYMTYPLVNALNFAHGFTKPTDSYSGFSIAFYALCILGGAVFVYFLCDHKMYQQYGKHGTLESTFLVAFPAGIIGARIWYVIGNWTVDGFDKEFYRVFFIWEGGLTILGGAITGIVVGVLWFMWRNKKLSIWVAVDMIVPTILLAQAIGRVGNFFNVEVHGNPVPIENWQWLPMIVTKNGTFSSTSPHLTDGTFYLPLFLIEGFFNVLGYLVLADLFGRVLRKYTELGDLAFGYVLVYGLIRVCLEPLRDSNYNMGEQGYWSWIFSCLFVLFGALGIMGNHLVRYLLRKKKGNIKVNASWKNISLISFISLVAISLICFIVGIVLTTNNKVDFTSLNFDGFNDGVILLTVGSGTLLMAVNPLLFLFEIKRTGVVINA